MNELFQHSDEGHQSSDDDVSGDSSQAENSSAEEQAMFKRVLTNAVTICSWSPFNQYWILQVA